MGDGPTLAAFPKYRRHTYYFSRHVQRHTAPVILHRALDMTAIHDHRASYQGADIDAPRVSVTSYLVKAISEILRDYPQANSCLIDGVRPRIALFDRVTAKVAVDKSGLDTRAVLSCLIEDSDRASLDDIQRALNRVKESRYEDGIDFAKVRKLNALPVPVGQKIYNWLMARPQRRQAVHGSFTLSSLGGADIDGFVPISANTLAFGVARIRERPIWLKDRIVPRPIMPLTMVFDHRVMDGALAAQILSEIASKIEAYSETPKQH